VPPELFEYALLDEKSAWRRFWLVTVPLLKPGTKYLDRTNQVDVRLAKKFKVRQVRLQGQLDIFNLLNASSILTTVETFGSSLDRPSSILQGRLLAIGMQLTF